MQTTTLHAHPARRFFLRTGIATAPEPTAPGPTALATEVRRARQQEREHLARELHDVLGGELTAARLQLASLKSRLAGQSADIDQRLEHLNITLGAALALKRRVIDGLEPAALDGLGLARSLEAMAREFMEGSGVRLTTALDEVAADPATRLAVFRLVQEALTNMARHAGASEAGIVLRDRGNEFAVIVHDNGRGFDPARTGSSGHGLAGMRHRIESAGGQLAVESGPGQGTRIAATLPKRHAASPFTGERP